MSSPAPRPRADRTQLQQIIAGLTEGVILIDPDQTIAWANAAALAMHGVDTLAELGADVDEYRARFELRYRNRHRVLPGAYPMDRVLAGETFTEVTVEVGRPGEEARWTHRLRSLVLNGPDGIPECLVLVVNDATERYNAEERFERTFNANPAPAIICRLADLRYVKVNEGFQEMTGYTRDGLIGRSVYEIDVLEGAESRDLAIERLGEGRTIPQMEALLTLPAGGTKAVIVAGQPIEMGDEPCMLFTFMDLEPRKRAEHALRQSEERFAKSFRLMPLPCFLCTRDAFRILDINDAFTAILGLATEETVGRALADLPLFADTAARRRFEAEIAGAGMLRGAELPARTADGGVLDCLVSAETLTIGDQDCVLVVLQDITERKRSEGELIAAIEAVMQDTSWFSRTVIEKLANLRAPPGRNRAPAELADLTAREREVLGLICAGLPDADIATRLGISRNTVRNQVAAIYHKLDIHKRGALIVWARERGIQGPGPASPARDGSPDKRRS
ncbi:helix-turn-helix transcriptional regulator [Acidisphaera rubrifaciens]|uniref:Transcriptional regulator LuxR n=1 Tax=Acidisphaera rubrifaciens HS-AP3 TaxID=1231350 RepID=A0A0D6P8Y0_9PROT|nr:helix-turn-helix transcriptional regulator [Acidisphaera rubrifaciens]GAN77324.1 transcriptional regulator LuxR [Acidisphaera rubrifaciens HS-AP3]